jgi:GxxExxY protein
MEDELSHIIIGAAIEVHRTLGGPGLLESIYEAALYHELILQGLDIQRQLPVLVLYKGITIKEPLYSNLNLIFQSPSVTLLNEKSIASAKFLSFSKFARIIFLKFAQKISIGFKSGE